MKKVHRRGEKSSPHDIYRDNKKININNTADATKQSSSKHIDNKIKKESEVINPPFTKAEYNQFIKQNQYNKIIDSDFLYESIVKSGYKQKNKMLITKDNWKSYIGFWVKKEIIDREKIKKTLAEQDDGEFDRRAMLQMLERRRKKEQEKNDKKG